MVKLFEDRDLPVEIEAFGKRGKVIQVLPRTEHTRIYIVEWQNGSIARYKGAATRPYWIKHIYRKRSP